MNELVSIIVPCYNGEKYLAEALESVFAQTYQNWECIIMDDGSVDDSAGVALSFQQRDNRFKYFHQPNAGTSVARNKAIIQSSGKYILPLDCDDKISPDYVELAVNIMEKDPSIKLVYCEAVRFGKVEEQWHLRPYSFREMLIENIIFCTALFRRKDFDATPGFSEDMKEGFEDWDFWLSFLNESDKVYQIPEVHFYYRIQDFSRNPSANDTLQLELRRRMYERHKEKFDKYFQIPGLIYDYSNMRNKYNSLNNLYKDTLQSTTLKVGRMVLKPYRLIKNIFK